MKKKLLLTLTLVFIGLFAFGVLNASAATYGDLTYEISNGEVTITDCNQSSTEVTVPDTIEGYPVMSIGGRAFSCCYNLTNIDIPDSVTSIGDYAFEHCYNLTSITLGDGVTSIGDYVFYCCESLTTIYYSGSQEQWDKITIGDYNQELRSVYKVYDARFYGDLLYKILDDEAKITGCKKSATVVEVPETISGYPVTYVSDRIFYDCIRLTDIVVDDNNLYYSSDEFGVLYDKEKTNLIQYPIGNKRTSFDIPDSVTGIGDYAFRCCRNLNDISIPDSVTSIGNYAFDGCDNLICINIPDSVTDIGQRAFSECSSLTNIFVGKGVTDIGYAAFRSCENLIGIYITDLDAWCKIYFGSRESNPLCYGGKLYLNITPITNLNIPSTVTEIKQYVFYGMSNLTSITIPDSITSIGDSAFVCSDVVPTVNYNGNAVRWDSIGGNRACASNVTVNYFWYVTYIDESGAVIKKETVANGFPPTLPEISVEEGNEVKFYTDSNFTKEFNPVTFITKNTNIYVKCSKIKVLPYTINSITIKDKAGNELSKIPEGTFLATVSITNNCSGSNAMVILAKYSKTGEYKGLMYVSVEDMPIGATFKLTVPVDNTAGDVEKLKSFVWNSFTNMTPMGDAVTFPVEE